MMTELTAAQVQAICDAHQYLNDARLAVAAAAGVDPSHVLWYADGRTIDNSLGIGPSTRHRILDVGPVRFRVVVR